MTDDLQRIFNEFFLEASFLSIFPNRPTNSSNAPSMILFPVGQPCFTPFPTLLPIAGDIVSTKTLCYNGPNNSCNWSLKEQMINTLIRVTK
jgi:hypothetical protein